MKRALGIAAAGLLVASSGFAANSLSVTGGAALAGSFGLQVNCDGSTNNVYVESQHPNAEKHYKASFLMRPAALKLPSNGQVRILNVYAPSGKTIVQLSLRRNTGDNNWQLRTKYMNDNLKYTNLGNLVLVSQTSPNSIRKVTLEWQTDTANGATNGFVKLTQCNADGTTSCVTKTAQSGVDNDTFSVDKVRIGLQNATGDICTGVGGYNFDEFSSER